MPDIKFIYWMFLLLAMCSPAQAEYSEKNPAQVHMITYRGCEDACKGFLDFFSDRNLPVNVKVTDIARDKSRLPGVREQLRANPPDLIVTWGTSVSTAIIGKLEEGRKTPFGNTPLLFMIVADPVASNLIESFENSGRPTVTGVRNRVPEDVQLKTLFEYFKPKKLGILIARDEPNSVLNAKVVKEIAGGMGFEVISLAYSPGANGSPDHTEIPAKLAELARIGADAIYVGSSSFNLEHSDAFTSAALDLGLPVFSAYEQMVTESNALMSVANSYVNVGKLAAKQAQKILLEGVQAGDLPIATLNRFSIIINMRVADALGLYPPIQLIPIAEFVE